MAAQQERFYQLRPMTAEHLSAVVEIERASQPHPWSDALFDDCLRAGYSAWVCINPVNEVVAFAILSMGFEEAHLLNIAVDPAHRRQGLATQLLDHVLHLARCAGAEQVLLEVRASNQTALRLYQAMGFHQLAVRPAYYPAGESREDALILALPLPGRS
jgi:ribosomal-protein-alanine N-acetyltransferase